VELHDCGIADKAAAAEEPARPSALVAVVDSTEGTAPDNHRTEPASQRVASVMVEYFRSHKDCKAFRTLSGYPGGIVAQVSCPMNLDPLAS